ncbi:amidase [Trametopsis cervina]|nr:amidase [Trametopsis cervina]
MWPFGSPSWKPLVDYKQTQRRSRLQGVSASFPSLATYIQASASEIVQRISTSEWTASEVLEAYIVQAAKAQTTTNCLTEVLFDRAREQAHTLDEYFRKTGKIKGPLHGVPFTSHTGIPVHVAGYDTTAGHTMLANHPAKADAELVRLVREAGGIPFVKTNLSQCLMFFECVNPVWGRSLNPYSDAHTCGGSSGGDCALLAMDGSALGWGNDVGGSLRIPASYCGLYTLKPGYGRISTVGARDNMPGFEAIHSTTGPIARTVADLELACRVVMGKATEDYEIAPIPYRDVKLPDRLTFGYYVSDPYVRSSPACQRAVYETVEALRLAGHECIELPFPAESDIAIQHLLSLVNADGNKTLFTPIGSDPKQYELTTVDLGPKIWGWARTMICWVLDRVAGDPFMAEVLRVCRPKSVYEFWKQTAQTKSFVRSVNHKLWDGHHFDGIISPVQAVPALPHQSVAQVATLAGATILYNLTDTPVGVVPVTRVDPDKDAITEEWHRAGCSASTKTSPLLEMLLYKGENSVYNAKKMAGLPVGIQIAGPRWEEEKVIEMMKVVDAALGPRSFGPGAWEKLQNGVASR